MPGFFPTPICTRVKMCIRDSTHSEAIQTVLNALVDAKNGVIGSMKEIDAVGHRVVHGGEAFNKSCLLYTSFINSIGGTALSIGSVKVNTINLMRIALETECDEKKYLALLKKLSLIHIYVIW